MPADELPPQVTLPLKTFLTFTTCPPRWRVYDLYVIRDDTVAFYVGQSACAFERVWEHIKGGSHGHSITGRFVLCNWPASARFTIELRTSSDPAFGAACGNLDAAECRLIDTLRPCFNISLNSEPRPLPAAYLPPNAPIRNLKSYRRMLREAGYAARARPEDFEW